MTKRIKGYRISDNDIDAYGCPIDRNQSYILIGITPICHTPIYMDSTTYRRNKKAERCMDREAAWKRAHPEKDCWSFLYEETEK